jgi:hypothetical protein
MAKGIAYIRSHWYALPRLVLGKLVRAYVPVPWEPQRRYYVAFAFRLALYLVAVLTLRFWRPVVSGDYKVYLLATFLVSLATTVWFYGSYRFTYCFEVFLVPVAAIGLHEAVRNRIRPADRTR